MLTQTVYAHMRLQVSVAGSAPLLLNAPEVWTVHGDLGNTSTPGGWVSLEAVYNSSCIRNRDRQNSTCSIHLPDGVLLVSHRAPLCEGSSCHRSRVRTRLVLSPFFTLSAVTCSSWR